MTIISALFAVAVLLLALDLLTAPKHLEAAPGAKLKESHPAA